MKTFILALLVTSFTFAQKVKVENHKGKLITPSIEKRDVPDALEYLPNGVYFLTELKARDKDGKMYFKKCKYMKVTKPITL